MIELNYKYADSSLIGEENGLNIQQKFDEYKNTIANIILDLN